jgi:hypothetical protein
MRFVLTNLLGLYRKREVREVQSKYTRQTSSGLHGADDNKEADTRAARQEDKATIQRSVIEALEACRNEVVSERSLRAGLTPASLPGNS